LIEKKVIFRKMIILFSAMPKINLFWWIPHLSWAGKIKSKFEMKIK